LNCPDSYHFHVSILDKTSSIQHLSDVSCLQDKSEDCQNYGSVSCTTLVHTQTSNSYSLTKGPLVLRGWQTSFRKRARQRH